MDECPRTAVRAKVSSKRVTVVAIVGSERSGSTVVDRLLGAVPGFFSTGELHHLWARALIAGELCACGNHVLKCPLWSRVLSAPELVGVAPEDVVRWQRSNLRVRHTPSVLRRTPGQPTGRAGLDALVELTDCLYRAISEVTGAEFIVDSSKLAADAALLRLLPSVDPQIVHLVRDPRAVTHAWTRAKADPARGDGKMTTKPPWKSASNWLSLNGMAEVLRVAFPPEQRSFLRYEDFVLSPRNALANLVATITGEERPLPLNDDGVGELGANHTVGGNPGRFEIGRLRVSEDQAWRTDIAPASWIVSTAVGAPLLRHYGYRLGDGSASVFRALSPTGTRR